MKLKNHQIEAIANAIPRLNGRVEVATIGEQKQVVTKPYTFGEGVRYAFTRTMNALKPALEAMALDRQAIQAEHAPEVVLVKSDHPNAAKIQAAMTKLANEEREVELHRVALDKINVDKNQLDPDLISDLWPMITEDEKPKE